MIQVAILWMAVVLTIIVLTGDTVKIRKMKELEYKVDSLEKTIDGAEFNNRVSKINDIEKQIGKNKDEAEIKLMRMTSKINSLKSEYSTKEDIKELNKSIYEVLVSVVDKDKNELIVKRYEETKRHEAVMKELE